MNNYFMTKTAPFINYLKDSNRLCDVILQSLAWMIVSMVAAYPSLCLHGDMSIFQTVTRDEYCDKFLIPIVLFLMAFILDFFFSIKDLTIGRKRGYLFKAFTVLICFMFVLLLATMLSPISIKIVPFILLWMNISLIKGLTVLIPGEEDEVTLKKPLIDI